MIIFPAIDIKEGKVVRLLKGDFDQVTEYSGVPATVAQKWQDKGAQWLHVVDLDGARTGKMQNIDVILKIAQSVQIPIQVGGGVRQKDDIAQLIEGGIRRVILGTKAVEDRVFFKDVLAQWKDKIAVSVDCMKGMVTQRGWQTTSTIRAVDFVKNLEAMGLSCMVYTDVARDGMLNGPNFEELKVVLKSTKIPVIASGGVSSLDDVKKLAELEDQGLMGAIIGKAIYEGKVDLKEALKVC